MRVPNVCSSADAGPVASTMRWLAATEPTDRPFAFRYEVTWSIWFCEAPYLAVNCAGVRYLPYIGDCGSLTCLTNASRSLEFDGVRLTATDSCLSAGTSPMRVDWASRGSTVPASVALGCAASGS